jgi:hypothetical protein
MTLCRTRGFHGGDYEECRLLRCGVVWIFKEQTFRSTVGKRLTLFSLTYFTLKMKATCSSETSVLARSIRSHITEDGILHLMTLSVCNYSVGWCDD